MRLRPVFLLLFSDALAPQTCRIYGLKTQLLCPEKTSGNNYINVFTLSSESLSGANNCQEIARCSRSGAALCCVACKSY